MTLGDRIRRARTDANMRSKALADAAGISTSLMSQIELNQTKPSRENLERIAKALDQPPEAFIEPDAKLLFDQITSVFKCGLERWSGTPHSPELTHTQSAGYSKSNAFISELREVAKRYSNFTKRNGEYATFLTSTTNRLFTDDVFRSQLYEITSALSSNRTPLKMVARAMRIGDPSNNISFARTAIDLEMRHHTDHTVVGGQIEIHFAPNQSSFDLPREIFDFPSLGTLQAFATHNTLFCDDAYFEERPQPPPLRNYISNVLDKYDRGVIVYGTSEVAIERFYESLSSSPMEMLQIYQPFFSTFTRPRDRIADPSSRPELGAIKIEFREMIAMHQKRRHKLLVDGFEESNVAFRQICSGACIEHWIQTGQRRKEDPVLLYDSVEGRIEHLNHVMELLKQHDRCEIAISDDFVGAGEPAWSVHVGHKVILEAPVSTALNTIVPSPDVRAQVDLRDVADVFAKVFDVRWQSVPAPLREKRSTIERLEAFRNRLEAGLDSR